MYYPYEEVVIDGVLKRCHAFGHASYALAKTYVLDNPKYKGIDYSADQLIWTADVTEEQEPDIDGLLVTKMVSMGINPKILSVDQINDGSSLTEQEHQEIEEDVLYVLGRRPTRGQEKFYDGLRYMFSQLTEKGEKINLLSATSGVKVTETDLSQADIGGKRITETMPNFFQVPTGEDVKIRFLPPYPKFEDHHIAFSTKNWRPDDTFQSIGRIRRKKFVPKIVRIGRYYTQDKVAASAPRSLKFNTRRLAKRFFSKPVFLKSQQQLVAMFGKPDEPRIRVQILKERPQSNSSDKFYIKRDFGEMKFTDEENPNV